MSILRDIKVSLGLHVHTDDCEHEPIINEEMKEIRARQMELQSRLKVLEIESELVKHNVK